MDDFWSFANDTLRAIEVLQENRLGTQLHILIYASIDVVAWANQSDGDLTRKHVCAWVLRYMLPGSNLPCSSEELYAARCSLLHASAAESKSSREKGVREVYYFTGDIYPTELRGFISDKPHGVAVRTADLVEAFCRGLSRFSEELANDAVRSAQVHTRIRRWRRLETPAQAPLTTTPR